MDLSVYFFCPQLSLLLLLCMRTKEMAGSKREPPYQASEEGMETI